MENGKWHGANYLAGPNLLDHMHISRQAIDEPIIYQMWEAYSVEFQRCRKGRNQAFIRMMHQIKRREELLPIGSNSESDTDVECGSAGLVGKEVSALEDKERTDIPDHASE